MSAVQSSPQYWLQMRPLDCAFPTCPTCPTRPQPRSLDCSMRILCLLICWIFGICHWTCRWKWNPRGKQRTKKREEKKHAQSQQEYYWKHQTSDKDLLLQKKFLNYHSCIVPQGQAWSSQDEPSQEGSQEHYEKFNVLYNPSPYQTLLIRQFTI